MKSLESIDARQQLEEILAKDEYQVYYREEQQNLLTALLERLKKWLYDNLKELFPNVNVSQEWTEWLTYAIVGVGVLLFALLIFFLLSKIVKEGKITRRAVGTAEDLALSPAKHLQEAKAFADNKDFRFALRHLFLALILHLDEEELIDAKPWKTNWEYYYELAELDPAKAKSFQLIAAKFDEVMYGGISVNENDYIPFYDKVIDWIGNKNLPKGGVV